MKKSLFLLACAAALILPSAQAAYDGQVGITGTAGRIGNGGGGPFDVNVSASATTAMNQVVNQGNPFISFCLELNEHINLNGNQGYYAVVANTAVNGGGGPNPDPISLVTAYLYSQFRANVGAYSDQQRDDLQNAIWFMEEEIGSASAAGAALVTAAKSALGQNALTDAQLKALNANGAYNVRALNVYSNPELTSLNQDMLAMVPEPSTYAAGALLLIPVLVQIRRKLRSTEA